MTFLSNQFIVLSIPSCRLLPIVLRTSSYKLYGQVRDSGDRQSHAGGILNKICTRKGLTLSVSCWRFNLIWQSTGSQMLRVLSKTVVQKDVREEDYDNDDGDDDDGDGDDDVDDDDDDGDVS